MVDLKGKAGVKIGMQHGKRTCQTDARFWKPPKRKIVSGLLPVQSVSPQYVRVLHCKGEWMSFLTELIPLIET